MTATYASGSAASPVWPPLESAISHDRLVYYTPQWIAVTILSASRVAPCPQLVDIVCRVADPSKLSALVQLLVRRARLDSGVQRVRIEATPPLVYDDEDELGDYDTSFEDSFSSGGLSEADRQVFEDTGVILSNGYVGDYVDSGC